ncbi:MAG: RluA family pseudouridine synthase [Clostridiales bacterium]|nr:RluA family pseudouridine synthase [Clostridiales bacterium]
MTEYKFTCETDGVRIDKFTSECNIGLSRSAAANLIEKENVLVNGNAAAKNYKLKSGDIIEVKIPDPIAYEAKAENIPLDIVYEDKYLLVVNKPKGMVVHPAVGNYEKTLVNALLYHCKDSLSGINGVMRPGIVHRIDKDTSGLLIVAKNDYAHAFLAEQIKEHTFTREYEAVVFGNLKDDCGTVDAPIGRNPNDRKKMCVISKNSKNAVTHYSVIKRYNGYTHIKCRLETGRTHQIRVHMAYIGHPVSGDKVYGLKKEKTAFEGQCLHAKKIGFIHPKSNKYMEFDSDLPDYFKKYLQKLEYLSK